VVINQTILNIMMYFKIPFYIGISLFLFSGANNIPTDYMSEKYIVDSDPCWPEIDRARTIIETFITHPNWASERISTGTNGLDTSQIQLLTDSQFTQTCQDLNTRYSQTISKTSGANNDRTYDFVYYKAGNFYFAVIVLAPPSDPDEIVVGLSYISVFDNNLNRLAGYSF
jgi:hypothetical protein